MFKTKDYILTPVDLYRGILHLVKKTGPKDIIGLAVLAGLFIFFRNYLEWQTDSSLFMLFWIALFYWKLDSRISIVGALISLVFCPIFLILENNYGFLMGEIWAEQSAVWAYYFLVIGVTKQIWEFRKEDTGEKDSQELAQDENVKLVEKTIRTGNVNEFLKQEELVASQFSQKDTTSLSDLDPRYLNRSAHFEMTKEMMREKGKTIDEIIEEVQYKQNKINRQVQQKTNIAKQRMMMDVIPPKK